MQQFFSVGILNARSVLRLSHIQ